MESANSYGALRQSRAYLGFLAQALHLLRIILLCLDILPQTPMPLLPSDDIGDSC